MYNSKYLFVSAAPFEGGGLFLSESGIDYLPLGVGVFESTQNNALNRSRFVGKDIVFVGTAGTFADFTEPSLYLAEEVCWKPLCERLESSYQVPVMSSIPLKYARVFDACSKASVVCAPNITQVEHDYSGEDSTKQYLENIELYSCALAAKDLCNSFSALLVSTNKVGPRSHEQWKANHKVAANLVERYLKSTLAL